MPNPVGHLLLAHAIRRGLVRGDAALRLAAAADQGGDVRKLLLASGGLRESDLEALERDVAAWAAESAQAPAGPGDATVVMPAPASRPEASAAPQGSRYAPGREIGRGGLARVVEAEDKELGRSLALKLLPPDSEPGLVERFLEEARITGQLEHPNIVPVHGMGSLPGTGEKFMAMKRIHGRDMRQVIRDGSWGLRQLVEAFQHVCRAVAYAHSRGIVHRDLKPANIMLGEFGEVLVVDWGLARRVALPHGGAEGHAEAGNEAQAGHETTQVILEGPTLTPAGGIMGTPSYMSPEQAAGRTSEVDERSDVYSLGATLYEILARRAPYESPSGAETLKLVLAGRLPPPSRFHEIPAELEAISLRAMSFRREDRYGSVVEMGMDLENYLKGTREHEGRARLAREQVDRAISETARSNQLKAGAESEARKGDAEIASLPEKDWLSRERVRWRHEDLAAALRRESIEAWAAADAALDMALTLDPESRRARELKAGLHWGRFLEAEERGDENAAILSRRVVERFNDGAFDARLGGAGTIEVVTRAWRCACLREGREVLPEELAVLGFHPWSGRSLDGRALEVQAGLEPGGRTRLRVHSPSCALSGAPGAEVWAWRYESVDRMQIPRTPGAGDPGLPEGVLDRLFGESPYRPQGRGALLGRTPLRGLPLAKGSWLLVVIGAGAEPFRVPVHVGRQQDIRLELVLPAAGEVPAGFQRVPAGEFTWQGDREIPGTMRAETRILDEFLMAAQPVTCREYAEYLNDLLSSDPAQAAARSPRGVMASLPRWGQVDGRGIVVPTAENLAAEGARLSSVPVDWEEDWPILGISWEDACAYARWRSLRDGRPYFLPHEAQWEKAARGPDGRGLPWGNEFLDPFANTNQSHENGARPTSVHKFPHDESPYGVRGLAGNARDWCLNDPGENVQTGWRCHRGGCWLSPPPATRAAYRNATQQGQPQSATTIRLATVLTLPAGRRYWPLSLA